MKRDFNNWLGTFRDSIATFNYYVDFGKVYKNVEAYKAELCLLNSLINEKDITNKFIKLLNEYPKILNVIPILLAKREKEIYVIDGRNEYVYNFKERNYSIEQYALFMEKTGLFDMLQNHVISSLYDYMTGVEVGLDTNARKNRTGDTMENIIESFIIDAGFEKDVNYFKEMNISDIQNRWGIDLSNVSNDGKAEKRFDFVIRTKDKVYGIETNFYSSQGSKLNETARSYKQIAIEVSGMKNFEFVWFTDGQGWFNAKNNLQETFEVMENIYNINDLKNGILKKIMI